MPGYADTIQRQQDLNWPVNFGVDILLAVISTIPLPPLEQLPSLKCTCSLYKGNLISADSVEGGYTSQPNTGSQQRAPPQYNTSINTDWSLPVTSDDLGGMPVHIDIDRDIGMEMGMPFHSTPYGSKNTLSNHGVDGMVHRFSPVVNTEQANS
ncbi:hypothetical protein GYMLUDRAFT_248596 [Collybiopsis luxurians FD-317 M1]|uniref:Uncharacterized protein n=1 Tax=Collybiopsis luxurians FD-317 M1 TaxID=944289 RepID=A0A0D0CBX3_9AGAR|nr:hypothetical protein GYMLUDRAFT_248596 [Collybiopsis luxurians FD-317 M1]